MYKNKYISLEEVGGSNVKAFEEIYRAFYSDLCGYAYTFVHDRDIVKDFVQDIFSFIWFHRKHFETEESLKYYLYRAVKNKVLDYLKHRKVKTAAVETLKLVNFSSQADVEEIYRKNELAKIIEKYVNDLPEKCREVFVLVKFQGMSYKETAKILGISSNTVENQMVKAFTKLRKALTFLIK